MWRNLRIAILLLVLAFVALETYFDRVYSTDWDDALRVAVFPLNADGSDDVEQFIGALRSDDFTSLEEFFLNESREHGLTMRKPVQFALAPTVRDLPPTLAPRASALGVMWWSLKARFWAWRHGKVDGVAPDVKLFALYHDPQRKSVLPHSIGMQKGLFGIVNLFAERDMTGANDTVLAHELLHTLGATDKYDPMTSLPIHPHGYAEPAREPLHPQQFAELMGGRIAIARDQAAIPESLHQVLIGPLTAREIGWVTP